MAEDKQTPPGGAQPAGESGGPTEPEVVVRRRGRPWLGPAIACLVAGLVLIVLLIPGVLRFPEATGALPDDRLLEMQRETNRSLEERLRELQGLSEEAVCRADGTLFAPDPDGEEGALGPIEESTLTPTPSPRDVEVPSDSLPPGTDETVSLLGLLDAGTVLVIAHDPATEEVGMGTGFFVAPGKVLTNMHVVGDPPKPNIIVFNPELGGARPTSLVATSEHFEIGKADFALLDVPDSGAATAMTVADSVERLTPVVAAGFPSIVLETDETFAKIREGDFSLAPPLAVTDGIVTAKQNPSGTPLVLHTATVSPGNSGGPLVDLCGRVVGINTFVRSEETYRRMNYALAGPAIEQFLGAHGVSPRTVAEACTRPEPSETARAETAPTPEEGGTTPPAEDSAEGAEGGEAPATRK